MINTISDLFFTTAPICAVQKRKNPVNFTGAKHRAFFNEKKPDVLKFNPTIKLGVLKTGIKDNRLENLWIEKRAYTYPATKDSYPAKFICIDSNGQTRIKPHIYLNMIEVKPEFARQGVCSKIEHKIIKLAKRLGFGGRVILDATKIESPEMTKIPSPSLAHWKNGFRFTRPEYNRIMKRVLKGELPPEDAPEGTMYWAEQKSYKFIDKNI